MIETIVREILNKLTDPIQVIFIAIIVFLFLTVRMMVQLLNRKEDILEGLVKELIAHGNSIKEAVKLLEFLALGKQGK